jgi:hypothetical protein
MMEHTVSGIHLEKYIVRKSNWKKKMSQLKIITQNNKIACSLLSILLYTITHIVYIYKYNSNYRILSSVCLSSSLSLSLVM